MKKYFYKDRALAVSLLLSLAMAATDAPVWISLFSFLVLAWKWAAEYKGIYKPSRRITAGVSIFLLIQVYLQFGTLLGQEASNTLLIGLSALKVMDYEEDRDHKFLVLLGFIMIGLKAIFSVDFYWLIPSLLAFGGFWLSLLEPSLPQKNRFLLNAFLVSAPLTIFLFFAFPRIVVPWAMSRSAGTNVIGFSDQLNPGQVAQLAGVDNLAFRAKFAQGDPKIRSLYWRGSVLTRSEGLRWLPPRAAYLPPKRKNISAGNISYEVILEPGSKGYLFTLNQVQGIEYDAPLMWQNYSVVRTTQQEAKSLHYEAESNLAAVDDTPPSEDLLKPPNFSPRVQEWLDETKKKFPSPSSRVQELQNFFSNPKFLYTLKPGTYLQKDLEVFLFERRLGFCEHFAGAYASLARGLGIPSRVVVGYHGGSQNPYGGFWRISQRDAHAWVEIFVDNSWQQVDPTTWVAPLRLSLGAEKFFALSEDQQRALARSLEWTSLAGAGVGSWENLVLWIEDLNYRWTYLLMDFDISAQKKFWSELISSPAAILLVTMTAFLIYFVMTKLNLVTKSKRGKIEFLFDEVVLWAAQKGFRRRTNEPPVSFLLRLGKELPEGREFFGELSEKYDLLIYNSQGVSIESERHLRFMWRRVKRPSRPSL